MTIRIKLLYFDKYFKFLIISLFLKKVALLIFFDKTLTGIDLRAEKFPVDKTKLSFLLILFL